MFNQGQTVKTFLGYKDKIKEVIDTIVHDRPMVRNYVLEGSLGIWNECDLSATGDVCPVCSESIKLDHGKVQMHDKSGVVCYGSFMPVQS